MSAPITATTPGTDVGVHAGFPNAAVDGSEKRLSLDRLLILSAESTYLFRIRGRHYREFGIFDGDLAIVDRAISPYTDSIVVSWDETGALCLARQPHKVSSETWGVLTAVVHPLHPVALKILGDTQLPA